MCHHVPVRGTSHFRRVCWAVGALLTAALVLSTFSACRLGEPSVASADALLLAPQDSGSVVDISLEPFQTPAFSELASRVLVVYHAGLRDSTSVAKDYAKLRGIPAGNLCPIEPRSDVAFDIASYEESVKEPVRACLEALDSRKILYIVMSYRTPFRVIAPDGKVNLAVDALLSDVWDEVVAQPYPERNLHPHPYFAPHQSKANFFIDYLPLYKFRERPGAPRLYSVWRLDAPTEVLAAGLVRKALTAELSGGPKGRACFDRNSGPLNAQADTSYAAGEWALERAGDFARAAGFDVLTDEHHEEFGTAPAPARCEDAILYAGWYSLNNYNDAFSWAPGAVGFHLDSLSALHPRSGPNWSANALLHGITVTSGAIDEPYLAMMPQPDGVFHDLMQGAPVGDAFLRNTLAVKWRIIHIGDPLYRPFPKGIGPLARGLPGGVSIGLPNPRMPGGARFRAVVSAGADSAEERVIRLSTEPKGLVSGPETIRLQPGQRAVPVTLSTSGVDADTPVTIRVEWEQSHAENVLNLLPLFPQFSAANPQPKGGETVILNLRMIGLEGSGELRVAVRSGCPEIVHVPESVLIPIGATGATFEARTETVAETVNCDVEVSALGARKSLQLGITP